MNRYPLTIYAMIPIAFLRDIPSLLALPKTCEGLLFFVANMLTYSVDIFDSLSLQIRPELDVTKIGQFPLFMNTLLRSPQLANVELM